MESDKKKEKRNEAFYYKIATIMFSDILNVVVFLYKTLSFRKQF